MALAVHCPYPLLHAAAWSDFAKHVADLKRKGRGSEALRLWASVVEFQHMPPTTALDATAPGMPPLRQAACVNQPCLRCEEHRGGFQFPWIGPWTSKGVLVVPGATVEEAWRRREELQDKLDLLELRMLSDDKTATDFCPALWYKAVQLAAPLLGCASKQQVFAIWRQWQRGYAVWRDPLHVGPEVDPEREMARQAMVAWLEAAQANPTTHLAKPCFHCKTPCRRVCGDCGQGYCLVCFRLDPRPFCCPQDYWGEAIHGVLPALRVGQRDADVLRHLVRHGQQ